VYSLGLLLIEMLTGRRVFEGSDPRAVADMHLTGEVPSLTKVQPLLFAPSLDRLIRLVTSRDPARRPADAAALGHSLDELRRTYAGDTQRLDTPPVRPPTARERIDRITGALARPQVPAAPERASAAAPPAARQRAAAPARGSPPAASRYPASADPFRKRSIAGLGVVLALFVVVACGAYAISTTAAGQIGLGIPLPSVTLPDWVTGVVSGQGEVLIVTIGDIEGLNMRDAPGLQTRVIALLPNGARVRRLEGPRTVDGVPWLKVRAQLDGRVQDGWVSATFVQPE
jgi:hypothetical protein